MHGNGKLTKLTISNQVQQETSYKLAAEKATALSWSDPNLKMINPHQTMTIKKKHIAALQFSKNCAYTTDVVISLINQTSASCLCHCL